MRHERFAVVFANVAVRTEAGLAAQVTSELATVIVLDHDDFPAVRKNAADFAGVERDHPLDLKLVGHDAFLAGEFLDRFANHTFGRAPTDECNGGILGADQPGWRDLVDDAL